MLLIINELFNFMLDVKIYIWEYNGNVVKYYYVNGGFIVFLVVIIVLCIFWIRFSFVYVFFNKVKKNKKILKILKLLNEKIFYK